PATATRKTGWGSRTEITTVDGQFLLTCADSTCRIPSTRCAAAAVLTRMSGSPAGIRAAASTCARETCWPAGGSHVRRAHWRAGAGARDRPDDQQPRAEQRPGHAGDDHDGRQAEEHRLP